MDLIVIVILIVVIFFWFRKFESMIYFFVILDIFLRIVNFLKNNITSPELSELINNYLPISLKSLIDKYSSGILNEILIWLYVIIFIIFEYYIIKIFLKKRK